MAIVPTFDASTVPSPEQLATAGRVVLQDENGKDIKLEELYKQQKTIVIFIRHFLCGLCQDYISFIGSKVTPDMLAAHGVKLVVVGCGEWKAIKAYRELLGTSFEIYADPGKKSYVALGMTRRSLEQGDTSIIPEYLARSAIGNVMISIFNAFKMGSFTGTGDIKQLGGEFVLGPGPEVLYTHRMENTRGHAKISELLEAAGGEAVAPVPTTSV